MSIFILKLIKKVLSSDHTDCVLARKAEWAFDNQACMSKQGDSPDYECRRQLRECRRHGAVVFFINRGMSPSGDISA